jgi:hypothetical protein
MVYCRNPKQLCDFFETHGCLIRNKSTEIKFGVRISIDLYEINDYALNLLKIFNEQPLNTNNYADLDGTLRAGCLEDATIYSNAKILCSKLNLTIITNNVDYTPEAIHKQICKLNIDNNRLITPLVKIKKIIGKYPYIHANEDIRKYLGHINLVVTENIITNIDKYDCVVICKDMFDSGINNIAVLKYLINRLNKIYVYEFFNNGQLNKCHSNPYKLNISVPYFGDFLKLINFKGEIIDFGKTSHIDNNLGIMIGDVMETDGVMCQKNNGIFIHISNDDTPLRWYGDHFKVGHIDKLLSMIHS